MNAQLTVDFIAEEVHKALQQMHHTKAPGPDGMSPIFFQKYWHFIGDSVTKAMLYVLNEGEFPSALNKTFIALIPKK